MVGFGVVVYVGTDTVGVGVMVVGNGVVTGGGGGGLGVTGGGGGCGGAPSAPTAKRETERTSVAGKCMVSKLMKSLHSTSFL